ncbi:hypothetical protein RND81_09G078300 [Saponaria officinalis]|uniref:Cell wall protein n=1 Tax=Saponaria officinalis TaxID=3572 RepID=A0AAW1IJH5_SAPOF
MTNNSPSKTVVVFLIFSIVLALASNALAARKMPVEKNDNKKPDCIVDPDGSVLFPGLGRILVPIPGTVSYNPPLGDSGTFPGDDGDVPSTDGNRN